MGLSFLPAYINLGIAHLNYNFITEIRIRKGKPVIVCYRGEYQYLGGFGVTGSRDKAIICRDMAEILSAATKGSIYSYTEQMKRGFITCGHGIRIGLAGEYITQNGTINALANITSLNIRIPHEIKGCADFICKSLLNGKLCSFLIFSRPGFGKTTLLRDIALNLSNKYNYNVLVFDERCEISAMDADGEGFDLGDRTDVIRCGNKSAAVESAIRAMRPDVIITDELHGEGDMRAVKYAAECGIDVIASSHITGREVLAGLPFSHFVEITSFAGRQIIYDKNFVACGDSGAVGRNGNTAIG